MCRKVQHVLWIYQLFFCMKVRWKTLPPCAAKRSTMWFNIANEILNPFIWLGVIFENSSCPVAKPSGKDPIYFCFIELVPSISHVNLQGMTIDEWKLILLLWKKMNHSWVVPESFFYFSIYFYTSDVKLRYLSLISQSFWQVLSKVQRNWKSFSKLLKSHLQNDYPTWNKELL